MADWQRTLDIVDIWNQAQDEEITPQQLAAIIAKRLDKLQNFHDSVIDGIKSHLIEQFKLLSENEDTEDEDEFNILMNDLYNWADISLDGKFGGKKVCWIKTF